MKPNNLLKSNSLYKKLMKMNIILVIGTIVLVTAMLLQLFTQYYYQEKQNELLTECNRLNNVFGPMLLTGVPSKDLNYEMLLADKYLNARIWLITVNGIIYTSDPNIRNGLRLTSDDVKKVLSGKTVVNIGDFGGVYNQTVLSVGTPVVLGSNIVGAVFMNSPINDIKATLKKIYVIILLTAFAATVFALILSYIFSKNLSKPIVDMTKAAKELAKGDFTTRVSVKDNDEIGELGNTFNKMANDLEHLETMRRDFVANVSHELRSPITSIRGYIDGIIDGTIPDEDKNKYLSVVKSESERLNRLVTDLLDLAQLEAGVKLNKKSFDINEFIRRVLIKMSGKIENKDIDVDVDFSKEFIYVDADPDRIEQILINLIDNAVKFTPQGGKITIESFQKENKAYISVKDNGIGISKEDLPHIWDRFYKADKSRQGKVQGTGLGLSIVKYIIESHGGEIFAESEINKGTKFTFTLKIA